MFSDGTKNSIYFFIFRVFLNKYKLLYYKKIHSLKKSYILNFLKMNLLSRN